jgi:deazaflavin-dependent oxidoreductase (nitroreductase family)
MPSRLQRSDPRKNRLMRWMFRFPILLYRLHLGRVLGGRFLMLTHTGRITGKRRNVVVEVVDHDRATDIYYIASGWGEKSDWFQNVQKNPETQIHVGARHFATLAQRLPVEEAERHVAIYAREHPFAFRELSGFMLGERLEPTPNNARRLADRIPIVALRRRAIS